MPRFLDYRSQSGNNLIAEWYCGISVEARAMFDTLIDILGKTGEWRYPAFKRLEDGFGEVRWQAGNVQHLVIGHSWKNPNGYLLLLGCTHKQQIYNPPDALTTAARRYRGLLFENKGGVEAHEIPQNCP